MAPPLTDLPPEVVLLVEHLDDVPTSEGHACVLRGDEPVLTRVVVKVGAHKLLCDASRLLVARLYLDGYRPRAVLLEYQKNWKTKIYSRILI